MEDGLTILRPCTGARGEKPSVALRAGQSRNCLVKLDGLEIIRPCKGTPNERPLAQPAAASAKMCEFVEHTVEGDLVRLGVCPKGR
jgi:hypothetical protein